MVTREVPPGRCGMNAGREPWTRVPTPASRIGSLRAAVRRPFGSRDPDHAPVDIREDSTSEDSSLWDGSGWEDELEDIL